MNRFRWLNSVFWSGTVEGSGGAPASAPAPAPTDGDGQGGGYSLPNDGGSSQAIADDIRAIMNYDPFESAAQDTLPSAGAGEAAQQGSTGPGQQVAGTPPTGAPAAAPAVQAPPSGPSADQALREAAAALAHSAQQIPQVIQQATAPPQPQQDEWAPRDVRGQLIDYGVVMSQIPDQVIAGLASENPLERKQALSQTLGIAMHIAHRQTAAHVIQQLRHEFSQVMPTFVREEIQSFRTQQEVYKDFYDAFPALSHPAIRPIVQREAASLAQQLGVRGWTEDFRNKLGEHVTNVLRQFAAPAAVMPTQQTPTVMQSAPVMSGTSVRPLVPTAGPNQQPWDDLF